MQRCSGLLHCVGYAHAPQWGDAVAAVGSVPNPTRAAAIGNATKRKRTRDILTRPPLGSAVAETCLRGEHALFEILAVQVLDLLLDQPAVGVVPARSRNPGLISPPGVSRRG